MLTRDWLAAGGFIIGILNIRELDFSLVAETFSTIHFLWWHIKKPLYKRSTVASTCRLLNSRLYIGNTDGTFLSVTMVLLGMSDFYV